MWSRDDMTSQRSTRRWRLTAVVLCLAIAAAGLPAALGAARTEASPPSAHPRLLFSAEELPGLRARIAVGGVPAAAWQRVKERADQALATVQPAVVRADLAVPQNLEGLERPYNLQNEMPSHLIHLGMAYQVSQDARHGRHAVELLLALADAGWQFWSAQELGIGDLPRVCAGHRLGGNGDRQRFDRDCDRSLGQPLPPLRSAGSQLRDGQRRDGRLVA